MKLLRAIIAVAIVMLLQAGLYRLFLEQPVLTWGATQEEAMEKLTGDDLAPYTSSTRAVDINAPREKVWQWMVQLGADRSGFYSYTFLENLLGYEISRSEEIRPEFQAMPKGRVVPSQMRREKQTPENSWLVVAVEPGNSYVLEGWGPFVVRESGPDKARLLVRTHGWDTPSFMDKVRYFLFMPMHYIMERRMMLGIKERAEGSYSRNAADLADNLWVAGIALSGLGILLIIILSSWKAGVLLGLIYGFAWQVILLITEPSPFYSIPFFALVLISLIRLRRSKAKAA